MQGQRWRLNGGGGGVRVAAATGPTAVEVAGSGEGEAAVAAAEAAVGLLPRSALSSHLRGSSLLFFSSNDG